MEGEKLCPLVRRPCDENCALYDEAYCSCTIRSIANELGMIRTALSMIEERYDG